MFQVVGEDKDTDARIGLLNTGHGAVETPAFLPVATKGVVKTLDRSDLRSLGVPALIVNAFHLWLRGSDSIENVGGLHRFMNWDGPIFTDSGGFQIIRKDFDFKISDQGFELTSPIDGSKVLYSPEICMDVHSVLGSDVAFVLDDCPPYPSDAKRLEASLERTAKWAQRCAGIRKNNQLLFGIPQGGTDPELRGRSAKSLSDIGFDGYGIGGLSIGEPSGDMILSVKASILSLPPGSPRHLMGVGSPVEILESISLGVDLFDSAFPTRNARHGTFYTDSGKYDIRKRDFKGTKGPLDDSCDCFTCAEYSASYIHHLFREKEMLAYRLLSIHNLRNILSLFRRAREAIRQEEFLEFKKAFISGFLF